MLRSLLERLQPRLPTNQTAPRPATTFIQASYIIMVRHATAVVSLALLTLLALTAAYALRPTVHIDLGDYYDSVFVRGFHAREVDGSGDGDVWEWLPDQEQLVIPGNRSGDWVATIEAAEHLPDRPLQGAGVYVNDLAVNLPGKDERSFTAFIPAELAAADQLVLRLKPLLTGGPQPKVGVAGRVVMEPARTYRWSRGCKDRACREPSTIALADLGRGAWHVEIDIIAAHPDNLPLETEITANGVPLATVPDSSELRRISVMVPASVMHDGDLEVTIRSNTYEDPRPLGILVSRMAVMPLASGTFPWLPPHSALLYSVVIVVGAYASLSLLGRNLFAVRWLTPLLVLLVIVVIGWAMAIYRFPTSFMLPGVALLLVWSVALLLVLRPLLVWAFRAINLSAEEQPPPHQEQVSSAVQSPAPRSWFLRLAALVTVRPSPFINALLLIFFVGYWIKSVGMLYPYFIGIDIHWHMERVRWILDGQLPLLYGTDSPLNESTMPEAEWGPVRPVIPYSPYFHMFATVFALLPWSLEMSANLFSALLDCSQVFLIALLARKCDLSERATVLAALLYAILPVKFLLHSWGNLPTTTGLWWAFAFTAFLVVGWLKLHRRVPFVMLVLILLASLLFYTVSGAFVGLFLVLFTLAITFFYITLPSSQKTEMEGYMLRMRLRTVWLAVGAAVALALLIYYGQYIAPIITQTVPYFAEAFTQSHEETGRVGDTLSAYLARHTRLTGYGLVLPMLLGVVYLVWEWRERAHNRWQHPALLWAAVAAWYGVMVLFVPLAYKISMVDKHFFVAIPLMVIGTGSVLDRLWARGWPFQVATLVYYSYLAVSALHLWLTRIVTVKQE